MQKGFSLIELMIALVLGLIVVAGTISLYVTSIKSSSVVKNSSQLSQELGGVMTVMTNDIRRAGYWGEAISGSDSRLNIFNGLNILNAGDCILYSYDTDSDGAVDANEYYGFKLNAGTVQIRTAGSTITNCSDNTDTWVNMLDSGLINVTTLIFSSANSKCINVTTNEVAVCSALPTPTAGDDIVEVRYIEIQLDGQASADTTIEASITSSVRVKNNRVYTQ